MSWNISRNGMFLENEAWDFWRQDKDVSRDEVEGISGGEAFLKMK